MLLDRDSLSVPADDQTWQIFDRHQQDAYGQELESYSQKKRDVEAQDPRILRLEKRVAQLEAKLRSTRQADMTATEDLIAGALGHVWKELREQIAALEERKTPTYRGIYTEGLHYDIADMTSYGGSIWYCRNATNDKPTTSSPHWTLAVRHGRDGKDAIKPG